jgi:hypothetical protein
VADSRLEKHMRRAFRFMPVDGETNVLHKSAQLTVAFLVATFPIFAFGQTAQPPQFFVVCASQPNQATIYFSGVLQGPAAALAGFRTGFTAFLTQVYAYSGAVSCSPTNTAVNAQNFITNYSTAYRKAKKSVVDTGWTESALAAMPVTPTAAVTRAGQTSPAAAATSVASSGASSGGSASDASPWASVLGSIFGPGGGGGAGAGGGGCGGTATAGAKGGGAKPTATGNGGAGCQSGFEQVSTTLTSVFANKTTNGTAAGEGAPKNPQPTAAAGGLGSAQAQGTKLVVYGCGRQDTRVACVTDLTNQSQKDTLVQAADVWKDTFIVDDRGDRHQRSGGFFLNVDGDQRQQLDISYGKTARFVLMFDGVQPKVDKVALRSTAAALDIEEIVLVAPNAGAQGGQQH